MSATFTRLTRRQLLHVAATASAGIAGATGSTPSLAQARKVMDGEMVIAQIVDTSQAQQDVSKDFLIGARAAWAEVNMQGGLFGRKVIHRTVEVDGSLAETRAAVSGLRDNPSVMAMFGTVGHSVALAVTQQLRQEKIALAHIAPWLHIDPDGSDVQTFPIFATRSEQIAFAIRNLSGFNVSEVGAVYASEAEFVSYRGEVERSAAARQLKVVHFKTAGDLVTLGQRLKLDSPAILLFLGGTPEIVKFTQGLEQQSRLRYCVAMADVNLQTMAQMGAARRTPVVVTQVVPMVNAHLTVVRAYRDVLARLFDEPPTPVSLAGYIAARYANEVMKSMKEAPGRQTILAAFQRSSSVDLGGFSADGRGRASNYVTQSMLATDGRIIG